MVDLIKRLARRVYSRWFWKPTDYEKSPISEAVLEPDDVRHPADESGACEFLDRKYKTARGQRYLVELCTLTARQCFVDLPEDPVAYRHCLRRTWALDSLQSAASLTSSGLDSTRSGGR
jgi:hypothetical protein